jgi:hypothetical protein
MLHHLLTLKILQAVARRYGVDPSGVKDDLIERLQTFENMASQQQIADLQAQIDTLTQQLQQQAAPVAPPQPGGMPPPTPAAIWLLYDQDRLRSFMGALGLQQQPDMTSQAMATALENVPGLTPQQAQATLDASATRLQADLKLQLNKQAASERVDSFLDRARTHFRLIQANDAQATTLLVNAALPHVAGFISANVAAGVTTIARHMQLITERFAPTRFQLYDQFTAYRLEPNQTAQQAGNELRRLYLGYLQLPEQDIAQHEPVIGLALTARLIDVLPRHAASQLRTELLRNPGTSWDQVQQIADQILQGSQTRPPVSTQRPEKHLCSVHGYCAHADADCRAKRYHRQPSDQRQSTDQRRHQHFCFACGKPGHLAADCPAANQQGNGRG